MKQHEKPKEFNSSIGILPPQATDIEEIIIGSVLLTNTCYEAVFPVMTPDFFYDDRYKTVFTAAKKLYNEQKPIDIKTVANQLKSMGKLDELGGYYFISTLTNKIATTANIDFHVKIVTQKYILRSVIVKSNEMIARCYDDTTDVFDVINDFENFTTELNRHIAASDFEKDFSKSVLRVYKGLTDPATADMNGITTGNAKLNSVIGGFQKKDLIILCARPGMGKTTRALEFALTAVATGKKPAIFSLEMGEEQLIKKFINNKSNISNKVFTSREFSQGDFNLLSQATSDLMSSPIYINDKAGINTNYIRAVLRERKKKHGVDIAFIDYLQLLKPNEANKGRSREQEVAAISQSLKELAKEIDIPIVALCQLSRQAEGRTDKRPIKSDLRESGGIEQDADIILGLYRPSQYWTYDNDKDYPGLSEHEYYRISEINVIKNRHGESEIDIEEKFYGEFSMFKEKTEPCG